ncbi:unnamed protein product, partial [Candidula unifasciata]
MTSLLPRCTPPPPPHPFPDSLWKLSECFSIQTTVRIIRHFTSTFFVSDRPSKRRVGTFVVVYINVLQPVVRGHFHMTRKQIIRVQILE